MSSVTEESELACIHMQTKASEKLSDLMNNPRLLKDITRLFFCVSDIIPGILSQCSNTKSTAFSYTGMECR